MPSKQCRVCGDVAIGFNFNVVTCNSCKTFFRRHALHQNFNSCENEGKCIIDKSTRRICKRCRFDKCLEIGMKKEIMFSRQTSRNIHQHKNQDQPITIYIERIVKNTTELKNGEYDHLLKVRNAGNNFPDGKKLPIIREINSVLEVASLAEQTDVLRVVKFCKSFHAFQSLSLTDQLSLLKHFYPDRNSVSVSYSYDRHKNGFHLVDKTDNTIFASLALFQNCETFDSNFPKFVHSFNLEMENDETIKDLILAQLLFRPRESIVRFEYVRYQHILYHYLMRRYLEHKYSDTDRANSKYLSLMEQMNKIDLVSNAIKQLYAHIQLQQAQMDQALVEIFNLANS